MSGYILCQAKKAQTPYFIENISTNIYSLEELCYYLYHNLYLVDKTIVNEGLCGWIAEELSFRGWLPRYVPIWGSLPARRMCCTRFLKKLITLPMRNCVC